MNPIDRSLPRSLTASILTLALVLGFALAGPPPAYGGGTYYVSTSGSDSNPGTSSRPWRTLQKAANAVPAGSTVHIRQGTYAGFVMTRSGTSSAPIVFKRAPGHKVVVEGNSSTVNVIRISGAHDIVIRGLIVKGAKAHRSGAGIRVENGSYRITIAQNTLTKNRSYGVSIVDSTQVRVRGNNIRRNAEGVYIQRAGQGVKVVRNSIHHQDRMVVATQGGYDDHGGVGVALVFTTGTVLVAKNRIWANRAPSPDWGFDGGAFEIYGASNSRIERNTVWDNRVVIETGSDGTPCRNNRFVRNIAYGETTQDVSKGMVFRCAENMLVANNTFYRLDQFVFDLKEGGTNHSTTIAGLRILNNIAVMSEGKIYGIESAIPSSVVADYNLVWHMNGGTIGSMVGRGWTTSLSTFRQWTGLETHGVKADPAFVKPSQRDFHLRWASPAINSGTNVSGVTWNAMGNAPDIGRFERR